MVSTDEAGSRITSREENMATGRTRASVWEHAAAEKGWLGLLTVGSKSRTRNICFRSLWATVSVIVTSDCVHGALLSSTTGSMKIGASILAILAFHACALSGQEVVRGCSILPTATA